MCLVHKQESDLPFLKNGHTVNYKRRWAANRQVYAIIHCINDFVHSYIN